MPHGAKEPKLAPSARSWTARPILSPDFTEDVPTEAVYIGRLRERKNIAKAIQTIAIAQPGFGHLKRCSASRLLLAPTKITKTTHCRSNETQGAEENDTLSTEMLRSLMTAKGFDLTLLEPDFEVIEVPSRAPTTKSQAQACAKLWPVNFHPDPNVEAIISGTIFNEERLQQIGRYTKVAIDAARRGASGNIECNGSVVVVDAEDGEILVIAASRTNEHPMWHAAMLAIDLVAKLQGGGAWTLVTRQNTKLRCEGKNCVAKNEGEAVKNADLQVPAPDVLSSNNSAPGVSGSLRKLDEVDDHRYEKDHKDCNVSQKRKFVGETPLCFPETLLEIDLPEPKPLEMKMKQRGGAWKNKNKDTGCEIEKSDANSSALSEEIPEEAVEAYEKSGPYLCTNYWVFMVREPCALCAMALLHSRVARIFYGASSKDCGVLGSRAILHATSGLNHRYQVWSGILEKDCDDVLREIESR